MGVRGIGSILRGFGFSFGQFKAIVDEICARGDGGGGKKILCSIGEGEARWKSKNKLFSTSFSA